MNLLKTTLTALALGIAALSAQAQTPTDGAASTPRVDKREARQQKRIAQGAASGQLTPRETQRLEREQNTINKAEDKAKADGTVTAKERRHMARMQNHASRDIHHQKHDAQTTTSTSASAPTK